MKSHCWLLGYLATVLVLCGCNNARASDFEQKISEAISNFLVVQNEARITLSPDLFLTVATGDALDSMQASLEGDLYHAKTSTDRTSEDFEVNWVEIIDSGPSWALVKFKQTNRAFTQNMETGEKIYNKTTRWYTSLTVAQWGARCL